MDIVVITICFGIGIASFIGGYYVSWLRRKDDAARERWSARHKLQMIANDLPHKPEVALSQVQYFIADYVRRHKEEEDSDIWTI